MDLIIKGVEDMERIGRQLRTAGDKRLRRDLLKAIRDAVQPTHEQVRQSALRVLPKRGGLADLIASSKLQTRSRLSGKQIGVKVRAVDKHDIYNLDRGRLRHPLYGNREHWYQQSVTAGWFTNPMLASGRDVRVRLNEELSAFAAKYLK